MSSREALNKMRLELAVMEADVRIEDLEAEIEKVKAKRAETQEKLEELN